MYTLQAMLCSIKIGVFSTILGYETLFRTSLWHMTKRGYLQPPPIDEKDYMLVDFIQIETSSFILSLTRISCVTFERPILSDNNTIFIKCALLYYYSISWITCNLETTGNVSVYYLMQYIVVVKAELSPIFKGIPPSRSMKIWQKSVNVF